MYVDVFKLIQDKFIPVVQLSCAFSEVAFFWDVVFDPLFESKQLQDCLIRHNFVEVCIVKEVSGVSQRDSARVSAVLLNTLIHGQEVARRLGHFFTVKHKVTVAEVALDHKLRVVPDGLMVVKRKCKMVSNQIFS